MTRNTEGWGPGDWQHFEAMARRGFARLSGLGGFAGRGGMGDSFRIGRMLASGDLRLVLLYLIEQQPRHGYDLIKVIEEKTLGFYSPSPGIIYPALTYLEDIGYVTASQEGNKKAYQITEEGRAHLNQNRDSVESTLANLAKVSARWAEMRDKMAEFGEKLRGEPRPDRDINDVPPEVNAARRELKAAIASAIGGDAATQRRLAEILRKAAEDIRGLAGGHGDDVDLG